MPKEGVKLLRHEDILSYEEITRVVRYACMEGVDKVRLTGGEPLVRRDITTLVGMLSGIEGIHDLSMTTNGILLKDYAAVLKNAGLDRVNVSLDTLDPKKYGEITRGGNISKVLEGLKAARKAGLTPVKINAVVNKLFTDDDRRSLLEFGKKEGYQVRFIQEMELEKGTFSVVEGGEGGDCKNCNRLRLTSDGKLKPCLFSNAGYSVRELGAEKAFELALTRKPLSGKKNNSCAFYRMGG